MAPAISEPLSAQAVQPWYEEGKSFERNYEAAVARLIEMVERAEESVEGQLRREQAIRLMGRMRVKEGAAVLVEHLTLPASTRPNLGRLRRYPAAVALVEIGSPSLDAVFNRLSHEVNERELRIVAFILFEIDGKKLAEERLLLLKESWQENPARTTGLENLKRLMEMVRSTEFNDFRQYP